MEGCCSIVLKLCATPPAQACYAGGKQICKIICQFVFRSGSVFQIWWLHHSVLVLLTELGEVCILKFTKPDIR